MDWPPNDAPASLEDLVGPICDAIRFAYTLARQHADRDIPWSGPEIGVAQQANCPLAADQLRAENLAYALDDQGRDALMEIVGLALRLGIEQGRRIVLESPEYQTLLIRATLYELSKQA